MLKRLLLRKVGTQFIETVSTEGKPDAVRFYDDWAKMSARLLKSGLTADQIALLKSELDSHELTSFEIP